VEIDLWIGRIFGAAHALRQKRCDFIAARFAPANER
jgi:hypothetical protein